MNIYVIGMVICFLAYIAFTIKESFGSECKSKRLKKLLWLLEQNELALIGGLYEKSQMLIHQNSPYALEEIKHLIEEDIEAIDQGIEEIKAYIAIIKDEIVVLEQKEKKHN